MKSLSVAALAGLLAFSSAPLLAEEKPGMITNDVPLYGNRIEDFVVDPFWNIPDFFFAPKEKEPEFEAPQPNPLTLPMT